MFIAHLPAGYIAAKLVSSSDDNSRAPQRLWWFAACLGSIFPDLDMIYFYTLGQRQTLHHHYWTHLPWVWLCIALLSFGHPISRIFTINVFIHLLLDTIAGGILWLAPFADTSFVFVDVPALHSWWVWNFIFHWSFALEIGIISLACYLWIQARREVNDRARFSGPGVLMAASRSAPADKT